MSSATMAKRKNQGGGEGADQPKDRHKHRMVGLRLTETTRAAVEAQAKKERRSVAQMCQILVEEALVGRGLIEPPPDNGGD